MHPLTYFEEEYNDLSLAINDVNVYLMSISDMQNSLKQLLKTISENTKIDSAAYSLIIEDFKKLLDLSKDFVDNYESIVSLFNKMSGDFYER